MVENEMSMSDILSFSYVSIQRVLFNYTYLYSNWYIFSKFLSVSLLYSNFQKLSTQPLPYRRPRACGFLTPVVQWSSWSGVCFTATGRSSLLAQPSPSSALSVYLF